jgi:uncharacterized membrane protein
MSVLLVVVCDNEVGSQKVIGQVQALQRQQLLIVSDAAIVIRQADEKTKVKQVNSLVGSGMWGGAFWGLLISMLFGCSLSGLVTGSDQVSDCGLDTHFVNDVRYSIKLGYSALFLMIAYMDQDKVLAALTEHKANQFRIDLNSADEAKLRDAFGVVEG